MENAQAYLLGNLFFLENELGMAGFSVRSLFIVNKPCLFDYVKEIEH